MLQSLAQVAPQVSNFVSASPSTYPVLGLILLFPLIGSIINGFWGKKIGREGVYITGIATVAMSFVLSLLAYATLYKTTHAPVAEGAAHGPSQLSFLLWDWFRAPVGAGVVQLKIRYVLDELSGVMLLVVTGVGTLIHIYSAGYMSHDEGYARYFAYLNLFMFSMLNLILGDSLVLLFVGWEGVGLCSYLLIGFWYTNTAYANAGRKAFIVNRIGDVGVILGMTILAWKTGSFEFAQIRETLNVQGSTALTALAEKPEFNDVVAYFLSFGRTGLYDFWMRVIPEFTWGGAACFFLFVGCTGKSAQLPLYVWLPDAMAGPTPVSALIHAATMVTAGVYLLCRLSFVYVHFPSVLALIAVTGALTALFAASIALVQTELKKVLAYSTVSQLGFMFAACGVGAFSAGLFHVYTHAMFKACLFLGAGAVMHACRDKQDLRELGGLYKFIPHTFRTFLVATLAIIGTPFVTAGFYSKDELLFRALESQNSNHPWVGKFVFVVLVLAATMTAFYMCRLLFLTFFGKFKGWSLSKADYPEHVEHAHDDHGHDAHDDHGHGHGNPWDAPKENPALMYIPLYVLAFMSVVGGFVGLPYLFTHKESVWGEWLIRSAEHAGKPITDWAITMADPRVHTAEVTAMIAGFFAFAVGSGVAYWVYIKADGAPVRALASSARPLYQLMVDKWRVDELYDFVIVRPLRFASDVAAKFIDRWIIDGLVNLVGMIPRALSAVVRKLQTGVVHTYAAVMVFGLVAMIAWVEFRPTVSLAATVEANNRISLEVHGGPGYTYQWDPEGDGTFAPTNDEYTTTTRQSTTCTPQDTTDGRRVCRVAVRARNAFGYTTTVTRFIEVPTGDREGR
ncbi:MAG: NADH-quinone oxidoreductase subunit L [Deltaproteobacteria bacterium]|nr:NADH-quinone oxidoreductase subunit L [Deltaproteobacteria bacterium]